MRTHSKRKRKNDHIYNNAINDDEIRLTKLVELHWWEFSSINNIWDPTRRENRFHHTQLHIHHDPATCTGSTELTTYDRSLSYSFSAMLSCRKNSIFLTIFYLLTQSHLLGMALVFRKFWRALMNFIFYFSEWRLL